LFVVPTTRYNGCIYRHFVLDNDWIRNIIVNRNNNMKDLEEIFVEDHSIFVPEDIIDTLIEKKLVYWEDDSGDKGYSMMYLANLEDEKEILKIVDEY
jgi:hypothetical protein